MRLQVRTLTYHQKEKEKEEEGRQQNCYQIFFHLTSTRMKKIERGEPSKSLCAHIESFFLSLSFQMSYIEVLTSYSDLQTEQLDAVKVSIDEIREKITKQQVVLTANTPTTGTNAWKRLSNAPIAHKDNALATAAKAEIAVLEKHLQALEERAQVFQNKIDTCVVNIREEHEVEAWSESLKSRPFNPLPTPAKVNRLVERDRREMLSKPGWVSISLVNAPKHFGPRNAALKALHAHQMTEWQTTGKITIQMKEKEKEKEKAPATPKRKVVMVEPESDSESEYESDEEEAAYAAEEAASYAL